MKEYKADLHIHSCLSPCASLDNSPSQIIETAVTRGLDMVALTDHNSGRNLPAFFEVAKDRGLIPIAGMELTTVEEVHLLAYFPSLEAAIAFSDYVYENLPDFPCDPDRMGDQVVVDRNEVILDMVEKYLGSALPFSIDDLVDEVHKKGGLAVPAHIDRMMNSITYTLGFLPDLPFDAVEYYKIPSPLDHTQFNVISNSDAHYLDDIGKRFNLLTLASPDFEGLKQYFDHTSLKPSSD